MKISYRNFSLSYSLLEDLDGGDIPVSISERAGVVVDEVWFRAGVGVRMMWSQGQAGKGYITYRRNYRHNQHY